MKTVVKGIGYNMEELSIEELQAIADQEAKEAVEAQAILEAKIAEEEAKALAIIEAEEKAVRMGLLHVRLHAVSHNNVAYVEAFGHEIHWSHHHKEICDCDEEVTVELLVNELEAALKKVNDEELAKKVNKEATKASLEVKLKALGLTIEEIKEL